ncbi:MAG: hypothetical protein ACTTGJ_03210 [Clostridium sp.]
MQEQKEKKITLENIYSIFRAERLFKEDKKKLCYMCNYKECAKKIVANISMFSEHISINEFKEIKKELKKMLKELICYDDRLEYTNEALLIKRIIEQMEMEVRYI